MHVQIKTICAPFTIQVNVSQHNWYRWLTRDQLSRMGTYRGLHKYTVHLLQPTQEQVEDPCESWFTYMVQVLTQSSLRVPPHSAVQGIFMHIMKNPSLFPEIHAYQGEILALAEDPPLMTSDPVWFLRFDPTSERGAVLEQRLPCEGSYNKLILMLECSSGWGFDRQPYKL